MNICLQRVEYYCTIILKGGSFLKYLPIDITCENFSHFADLLCRKKTQTQSIARWVFFNSGHKTKQKKKKAVKREINA